MQARGDRSIELGFIGTIVCRPGLRALEAIESSIESGSIADVANQLAKKPSLRTITTVIYETHLDFAAGANGVRTFDRQTIGAAVLEVGVGRLQEHAFRLVLSAFAPAEESDPGNG